jgi:predicted acylesterase/phospholipase RssA
MHDIINMTQIIDYKYFYKGYMSNFMSRYGRIASCLILAATLSACASLPRSPVPVELSPQATIPGMPDVRGWAGEPSAALADDFRRSLRQESAEDFPLRPDGTIRYPYLALSGGGANGAFGAGFMMGWTASGTRPLFKVVTGVSTGALMAPFVFLGPIEDQALRDFYTTTRNEDVFDVGSPVMAILRRDSMADTAPLATLISRYVDAELLARIAAEHRRGRRLYMGTVELDSRRFAIWNMGLIAERGDAEALALFQRIMLASSSMPVAFPPVLIEVEAGGTRYDEMHVDGFVGANVFLHVGAFNPSRLMAAQSRGRAVEELYIIHNGQLRQPPSPTTRSLGGIAMRSFEVSARAGIAGDLIREHAFASRDNAGFRWVTVGEDVDLPDPAEFDPVEMRRLYELGYREAQQQSVWRTMPPGLIE